ncbi:MAG: DNRLRE domain-containing protein [Aquabacterium sp.]|nr:DNRLRE domain-containing protein [Aquabacterium sp.]
MANRLFHPIARAVSLCVVAVVAQPDAALAANYALTPAADSQVSAGNAATNYGSDNFLDVHHGAQDTRRSYLRFDLTGLPAGQAITAATLFLYTEGGVQDLAIDLHHVADDSWGEQTVTWINKPDYTPGALATATTLHDWVSWSLPVASLVSADADGQWSLLLKLQDESASATATFFSRDATVYPNHLAAAPKPYLTVTTVPEASTWAMLIAGLGVLGLLRRQTRSA